MTRYTPLWQQGGSYPAQVDRGLLAALWPTSVGSGNPAVAVTNTMNVSIPAGYAAVALQSGQNTALCTWDAPEVVTSPAAPGAGTSRIDVVVCQVRDPILDAGVNNDFIFLVVAGVAAASPVAPAVPANAMAICQYTVPAAVANLNGVSVVDQRTAATSLSALTPSWQPLALASGWTLYGGGYGSPQYCVVGSFVYLRGLTKNATGATVSSSATIATLPVGARPPVTRALLARHGGTPTVNSVIALNINTSGNIDAYYTATVTVTNTSPGPSLDGVWFSLI